MFSENPLIKTELCKLAPEVVEQLKELMRQVIVQQKGDTPVGAFTVEDAARYLRVSRRKFYDVLKKNPDLKASSFKNGSRKYWPVKALDAWIAKQVANQNKPEQAALSSLSCTGQRWNGVQEGRLRQITGGGTSEEEEMA
jgi:hypothetical protein